MSSQYGREGGGGGLSRAPGTRPAETPRGVGALGGQRAWFGSASSAAWSTSLLSSSFTCEDMSMRELFAAASASPTCTSRVRLLWARRRRKPGMRGRAQPSRQRDAAPPRSSSIFPGPPVAFSTIPDATGRGSRPANATHVKPCASGAESLATRPTSAAAAAAQSTPRPAVHGQLYLGVCARRFAAQSGTPRAPPPAVQMRRHLSRR